jgi:diacylglycerol kinase (ATP)
MQTRKTLLLHNPTAGAQRPSADKLMDAVAQAGFEPVYFSTKDDQHKTALQKSWDLVIVAGGDGTVGRLARGLKDRSIPVAILPTGTANNIARSLGIVDDPETLLAGIAHAPIKLLDIGVAKGPWGKEIFLEAVGLGPVAEAISQSGPKPPKQIRISAGRDDLQDFLKEAEPQQLEISIDGKVLTGEFLLLEILNLCFTGPALQMAFAAESDDGLLDVIFLFESERDKMLAWLAGHPEHMPPPVTVRKGRVIELKWYASCLRIDSEVYFPPKKAAEVKITLQKQALRVVVPAIGP